MTIISRGISDTNNIAKNLASKVSQIKGHKIIALEGELGAGKTAFTKAFAESLGIKNRITSPTFVIMKRYHLPSSSGFFYHIDAYRLKNHKDLEKMEIREIISDNKNIIVIEWSDRVSEALPKNIIKVHIDHVDENTRKFSISGTKK